MNDSRRLRHPQVVGEPGGCLVEHRRTPESRRFYEVLLDHIDRRQAIAIATVVGVRGSASAKLGSKAILSLDGRNRIGWVGGGCAESFVIQQAQEAIRHGQPRRIEVDLNDEAFGVGMPCGGHLEVFIEPINPPRRVLIPGPDPQSYWLSRWATCLGFEVVTELAANDPDDVESVAMLEGASADASRWCRRRGRVGTGLRIGARTPAEEAVSLAASLLLGETGASGGPFRRADRIDPARCAFASEGKPHLVIVGHNRITEHLAALVGSLDWTLTLNSPVAPAESYASSVCRILDDDAYALEEVGEGSLVVIATQHKGDHLILRAIADRRPSYVGVVASHTRAGLLRDFLRTEPRLEPVLDRLHSPCGLDLGARSPFEIALSIACELIQVVRQTNEPPP